MARVEPTAVSLRRVTKQFDDVVAVDALDLDIAEGEFFSLLGPSGCGKTTTLRMIAGLELPTTGTIEIHGEEMATRPPNKRPVNTVFQNYALFPHLNVIDNVGFGLKMQRVERAETKRRVDDALELVQLGGYGLRRPDQLSGGQQQRVALARALVNQPKVLLLDEPLGALDLKLRQQMQGELAHLQAELGITFVFVTHDQDEALAISDRIGVMHDGKLLQVGTPETIYAQPTSRFVADFIGRANLLDATVEDADAVCLANGVRVRLPTEFAVGTPVSLVVRPEQARVVEPDEVPPGWNHVGGQIAEVTYLGATTAITVALDWMRLEVSTPNQAGARRFEPGAEVAVAWPDDAATAVERST